MSDTNCPYCGADVEINHDDGYGYEEDMLHQQECGKCENVFTFNTSMTFYYETFKAECLNGGEHKFEPTHTFPKKYTEMECTECGKKRKPTEAEMIDILTPQSGDKTE